MESTYTVTRAEAVCRAMKARARVEQHVTKHARIHAHTIANSHSLQHWRLTTRATKAGADPAEAEDDVVGISPVCHVRAERRGGDADDQDRWVRVVVRRQVIDAIRDGL